MATKLLRDSRRGGEYSDALKKWRRRQGWTQVEAAHALDVSRMHWGSMERGTSTVSRITLLACAAIDAGLEEWRPGQNVTPADFGSQISSADPTL